MKRIAVVSSNLQSVGYDTQTRTLEIGFLDGSVYQYYQVRQSIYNGLLAASSHGSYFHAHIRNHYAYRRVA